MSVYIHCFSYWLRLSTKWRIFILFTMGSTMYFELFMVRTNTSHSSRELGSWSPFFFPDVDRLKKKKTIFLCLLFYLYERGGLFIFSLSRGCLLVIITSSCGGRCLPSGVLSNPWNELPCFWHWVDKWWCHGIFSTDIMQTEVVINPVLVPARILERSLLMSGGDRLPRANTLRH